MAVTEFCLLGREKWQYCQFIAAICDTKVTVFIALLCTEVHVALKHIVIGVVIGGG